MAYPSSQVLTVLLRDVSRSFYLTLRVLPSPIRSQISLAYLLARTTDTIADTEVVPPAQRLTALRALQEQILETGPGVMSFSEFARLQGSPSERALLENLSTSLSLLRALPQADRDLVTAVLKVIISGQELDLVRFGEASAQRTLSLATAAELDDYTYRVAGCVGEFWTRMCRLHLFAADPLDDSLLLINGVRFGKGLQLVNVLRDLPNDLRIGRCYLPMDQLLGPGLQPVDLLDPKNEARLRPVYDSWLDIAAAHLNAGWSYTKALPRRAIRVRLACAWPLLLGSQTLRLLKTGRILDPANRIKVSRKDLRRIMFRSVLYYPWPSRWERLYP